MSEPLPIDDANADLRRSLENQVAAALPTSRHAGLLFDAVAESVGEAGLVIVSDGGRRRSLHLRDPRGDGWIVPWPLVDLGDGQRLTSTNELTLLQLLGPHASSDSDESSLPGRPMRGLRRGEILFGEEPTIVNATFSDEGMRILPGPASVPPLVRSDDPARVAELVRRLQPVEPSGTGTPTERLASCIARLDPGRDNPGRLRWVDSMSAPPSMVWMFGLMGLRGSLWNGSAAPGAGWLLPSGKLADEEDDEAVDEDGDPMPSWGGLEPRAMAQVPAQRPDSEVPAGWRAVGFTRWVRMMGFRGRIVHALVRGALPIPITIVGERLVSTLDPRELDAMLEWVHVEAGLPPLANGAGPPPSVPAHDPNTVVVGGRLDHTCVVYGPDARGVFARQYQNWDSELSLSWLEGDWLTHRILRIERVR